MINSPRKTVGGEGKTPPSWVYNDNKKVKLVIDWLTCTFDFIQFDYLKAPPNSWQWDEYKKGMDKLNKLYELLTYPDKSEQYYDDINLSGYKDGFIILGEHTKIFFSGSVNKNHLYHNKLEMSGQACKDFLERGGNWIDLFNFLLSNNANFTRVDVAYDIYTDEYFDLDKLYQYALNYNYSSPIRKWSFHHGGDSSSETITGTTLYFGSNFSNTLICIYDKKLEQYSRGIEIMDMVWYRIEIRFKLERAKWFINSFLAETKENNDFTFLSKALYAVLDFKDPYIKGKPTKNKEKRKWDTAKWWKKFLDISEKAKFNYEDKNEQTIDKKMDWLDRSVSKSLLQIYAYDRFNFLTNIYNLVCKKFDEFTNVDLTMINDKRLKEKKEKLTEDDILKYQEELEYMLKKLMENDNEL